MLSKGELDLVDVPPRLRSGKYRPDFFNLGSVRDHIILYVGRASGPRPPGYSSRRLKAFLRSPAGSFDYVRHRLGMPDVATCGPNAASI